MTPEQLALVANRITNECLRKAGDNEVNAALSAAKFILNTQPDEWLQAPAEEYAKEQAEMRRALATPDAALATMNAEMGEALGTDRIQAALTILTANRESGAVDQAGDGKDRHRA